MPASYLQPRRGTNGRRIMEHGAGEEMVAFYEAWVGREERIVADLTDALLPARRRRDVLAPLVDAAVGHVSEYYERKARLADRDVVAALDPRWLNRSSAPSSGRGAGSPRWCSASRTAPSPAARRTSSSARAGARARRHRGGRAGGGPGGGGRAGVARRTPRAGGAAEAAPAERRGRRGRRRGRALAPRAARRGRRAPRAHGADVVRTLAPDQAGAFLAAMLRFHLGVHRAGRNWGSGNGGRRGL